jgi:hypothetical protein
MPDTAPPRIATITPVRYTAEVEKVEAGEEHLIDDLTEVILGISRKTWADGHPAPRGVHAKSHALLCGELQILPGLPAERAQGLFARAASYPVILRFSTTPGDILPDSVSTPRGLGVKVMGVEGPRLPGAEGKTQDFVMVNGPAFSAPDGKAFLNNLKLLAATTDRVEGVKVAVSKVMQGTEKVIETFGQTSGVVRALGGEPARHPLGETYYTQAPVLYGDYIAKLSLAPVSDSLKDLTGAHIDVDHHPYALREAMLDYFAINDAVWDLRAQLCTDLDAMPVEDAAKIWPEEMSPYVPVARLYVPAQTAWSPERSAAVDDGMSFSPWHCLAAHRPLGSIMRLRRRVYEASAAFRAEHAGRPIEEPVALPAAFREDDGSGDGTEVFYP